MAILGRQAILSLLHWISLKSPGWIVKYDGDHGSWRWELIDTYHNDRFMQMGVWPD